MEGDWAVEWRDQALSICRLKSRESRLVALPLGIQVKLTETPATRWSIPPFFSFAVTGKKPDQAQ